MKNTFSTLLIASLVVATTSTQGQERATKKAEARSEARSQAEFDSRAHSLNMSVEKNGRLKDAIHAVSVETGVPEAKIEAMHKKHPNAGPTGILAACVLADETKKDPDRYLTRNAGGRKWTEIAADNNVAIEKLNVRLDRVENYVNSAPEKRKLEKRRNN
jgi:hypothetical protein